MAKKQNTNEQDSLTPDVKELSERKNVTLHLDRDPNDPRNVAPAPKLPSLDDPEMQGPAKDEE